LLAANGVASRRRVEEWIRAGRIRINGHLAQLGEKVEASDRVEVDGRLIHLAAEQRAQMILYHKPPGQISTRHDPQGRETVFATLPSPGSGRWVAVGRLDFNTSGLLLFCNDGRLAHQLMHPSSGMEREYRVRLSSMAQAHELSRLRQGLRLVDGQMARFHRVWPLAGANGRGRNHWYGVVVKEGRYHQVRRLWEACGHQVNRLKRIRFGPLALPRDLALGSWRHLKPAQLDRLFALVGLAEPHNNGRSGRRPSKTSNCRESETQ